MTQIIAKIARGASQKIGVTKTYLYCDEHDLRPAPLNYKNKVLNIPKAMVSFGADGAVVSTASDGIVFLKSFFEGQLFNLSHLEHLTAHWRNIFFSIEIWCRHFALQASLVFFAV